jgi:hypothetical protein
MSGFTPTSASAVRRKWTRREKGEKKKEGAVGGRTLQSGA